jgi:hypothetical protein
MIGASVNGPMYKGGSSVLLKGLPLYKPVGATPSTHHPVVTFSLGYNLDISWPHIVSKCRCVLSRMDPRPRIPAGLCLANALGEG